MLKVLGWLFLVGGILLCLTIFFMGFGIPMAVLGALLLIADALYARNKRTSNPAQDERQQDGHVSNSMFGR